MTALPNGFDAVARDLERLRIESGGVSYSEIAERITEHRQAAGASPGAAQIARSTIYDVFRLGRRRVNLDLVQEIVESLGVDETEAGRWRQRCIDARAMQNVLPLPSLGTSVVMSSDLLRNPAVIAMIVVACVGLNSIGGQSVKFVSVPLYLDMTGTAVAAVTLGPWFGVLAAVLYHLFAAWFEASPEGLWFTLVSVAGALLWGYGVRSWRMGRTAARFFTLNIAIGVACSMVAVPILVVAFGGLWGHPAQDVLVPALVAVGVGLWESVTSTNLLLSLMDKLLSGYLALGVAYALLRFGVGASSQLSFGPFRNAQLGMTTGPETAVGAAVAAKDRAGFRSKLQRTTARRNPTAPH